jgi:hypothetical protein
MEIDMRQYIIKQMHNRIMNADETANLEYPVWKRRLVVVGGFTALRAWSIASFAMVPVVLGLGAVVYTGEALKKIAVESVGYVVETFGANYRNLREDIRGCKNIWKGEYGRGKLLPERPEMKIKNPNGKPTAFAD